MSEEGKTEQTSVTQVAREPSQYETAIMIADELGEVEEIRRQYIVYLVRTLGRTQARRLLGETLQTKGESRGLGEIFFDLALSQGKPKRGQALRQFGETQDQPTEEQLPDPVEVARKIAAQLNETEQAQLQQILAIVRALGQVQAWAIMLDAIEIDEGEGMLVPSGERRRTVGGIFFYLAYTKGEPLPGQVFNRFAPKKGQSKQAAPTGKKPSEQPAPSAKQELVVAFNWEDRIAVIQEAEETKGQANVKITVVGRPGKIVDKGTCIVTVMESNKVPALPKGLPTPPAAPTKYAVYIASKQWKKVSEAIVDPEDVLIVEGFPTTDAQVSAIAVFATNVTTKKLQQAQKAKPQATV